MKGLLLTLVCLPLAYESLATSFDSDDVQAPLFDIPEDRYTPHSILAEDGLNVETVIADEVAFGEEERLGRWSEDGLTFIKQDGHTCACFRRFFSHTF